MASAPLKSVAGVSVPDTALCKAAVDLLESSSPDFLCTHCLRTYVFGSLAVRSIGRSVADEEAAFCGAALHDLGLVPPYRRDNRFEVDGADAAREFCSKHQVPPERTGLIWEPIALHTSAGIATTACGSFDYKRLVLIEVFVKFPSLLHKSICAKACTRRLLASAPVSPKAFGHQTGHDLRSVKIEQDALIGRAAAGLTPLTTEDQPKKWLLKINLASNILQIKPHTRLSKIFNGLRVINFYKAERIIVNAENFIHSYISSGFNGVFHSHR
jgi:HD domain